MGRRVILVPYEVSEALHFLEHLASRLGVVRQRAIAGLSPLLDPPYMFQCLPLYSLGISRGQVSRMDARFRAANIDRIRKVVVGSK